MKKRLLAIVLAVSIAASMLVLPASASSLNNTAIQTAITLGAMEPGQTGRLDAAVNRGTLAKMLVAFSSYRESAGKQGGTGCIYAGTCADRFQRCREVAPALREIEGARRVACHLYDQPRQ